MLATDAFMIVFRFLHIVGGAFWFGAAALFVGFIGPAAADVGPAAGPLLANAVQKRKVAKVITSAAGTTVLAGLVVYVKDVRDYGGLGEFLSHGFGWGLTIGAIAAIGAFFTGYIGVGRRVEAMVELGGQIAGAEGPPPPELLQRLGQMQEQLKRSGMHDLLLLAIAVICMATARYW